MTPRVPPGRREDVGLLNTGILKVLGLATGGPLNVFTTLARHPSLFRRWLIFAGALMPGGKLKRADSELVILRVAHNCGSDYELTQHERIAKTAGLSDEEIARAGGDPAEWPHHQSLLLRTADALHADRDVPDELWAELVAEFDEQRRIELLMLVGHYEMLAMTLNALRVESDPPSGPASLIVKLLGR